MSNEFRQRRALLSLLEIKDSDIRILNLEQCRDAVDKGLHAGCAFSAVVPLVALYYGGFLDLDIGDPTRRGQDMFTLSKGHAVATLASIYADLGYIDRATLRNSRSYTSILNGHPGPILPGIQIATGPMGQGMPVAQGFAIAGRTSPRFDSYCLVGDGELQEGPMWECVMYAGARSLDNLCVLVDRNNGQLDISSRMVFPMPRLEPVFESFGWQTYSVDATQYAGVYAALQEFKEAPRNGKPTAIICNSTKGQGAFSDFLNKHKVTMTDAQIEQELALQGQLRRDRVREAGPSTPPERMHLDSDLEQVIGPVLTKRVPVPEKKIQYDATLLPRIDRAKEYSASDIVTAAMKIFANDPRVVSIDSDLATTSGLEAGVAALHQKRRL